MNTKDLITRHEGKKFKPYTDTVGKLTIGVGRNLSDKGILEDEVNILLENDLQDAWDECAKYTWFLPLTEARKAACIDLMFNVGAASFAKFVRFIAAMGTHDYERAAAELFDSAWHRQVGQRAVEVEALIHSERWPE